MSGLILGPVTLSGFEIAGQVQFGGAQAMVVHRLPGGGRVVDVMGRDDADVAWSGIISGPDASDRARLLDAMRVAGDAVPLSWDAFSYSVVIARLHLHYANPWWIPYRMACTVVADQAQAAVAAGVSDAAAILGDLTLAAGFADVSGAVAAAGVPGALTAGTQASVAAMRAISSASTTLSLGIGQAQAQLQGTDLASVVQAAQSLAYLTCASGYVGRAAANLQNLSS